MFHALWPEGQPEKVQYRTSWWSMQWCFTKLHYAQLLKFRLARRIRHARCKDGYPDPYQVEARLRDMGAIAPPGGWTFCPDPERHVKECQCAACWTGITTYSHDPYWHDLYVNTNSVV
jgi:hypothetical protein